MSKGPRGAYGRAWIDVLDTHVEYPDKPQDDFVPTGGAEDGVENRTSVEQSNEIVLTEEVSDTAGWALHGGVELGVKTTVVAGLPRVFEGKVEISARFSFDTTKTWSHAVKKTWSVRQPVKAPPRTKVTARLVVDRQKYSIPFVAYGTLSGWVYYEYSVGAPETGDLSSIFANYSAPGFTSLGDTAVRYEQEGTHTGLLGVRCNVELTQQSLDEPALQRTFSLAPASAELSIS